jgi:oligopeptide/dipeptide ABC transporter ATP-binding protein
MPERPSDSVAGADVVPSDARSAEARPNGDGVVVRSAGEPVLAVRDLTIEVRTGGTWRPVVEDLSLDIGRNEILGLVGESGSGKTVTALAVLGLLPEGRVRVARGQALFGGRDLLALSGRRLNAVRGAEIAMIFQDPLTSLNPQMRVGAQVAEPLRRHRGLSRSAAATEAIGWLERVGLPEPERLSRRYPFELSGGMRQRVAIATALACGPKLLLADEPTTALDVTVQSGILRLLGELQAEGDLSILFVSHDLAVIAELCDQVAVMYAGQIVELAPADDLFDRPRSPYAEGLLRAMPRLVKTPDSYWIEGRPPTATDLADLPGCRFAPRCEHATPACSEAVPPLVPVAGPTAETNGVTDDPERAVRCIRADELQLEGADG